MNIVNDKVTLYLDALYRPLNNFLKDLRIDAEEKNVPIIMKETELCLLNFIRMKKATAHSGDRHCGGLFGYLLCGGLTSSDR